MKSRIAIAGLLAASLHALALFGFYGGSPAKPLPMAPESLEVKLTAAPEDPIAASPEIPVERPPEPPVPEPIPLPEPVLPPEEPPTPMPEPLPEPERVPKPENPPVTPRKPEPPAPKPKPKSPAPSPKPAPPKSAAPTAGGPAKAPAKKSGPTTSARVRSNPSPAYPPAARQARQEGVVTVDVQVSAAGLPVSVTMAGSSGFPALDQAALAAVRRWRFEPAQSAGVAIAGRVRVPVRFKLNP